MIPDSTRAAPAARAIAVAFALLLTVSVAATGTAGAASATTVRLDATDENLAVSETTTVDVVVEDVDGGVGAYDLAVELADPSVATITDVELVGEPDLQTVDVAQNGSRADLMAALLDTDDAGRVAIATVTLSGAAPGATDVTVSVSALGDEDGSAYSTETRTTAVNVAPSDETRSSGDDDADRDADDASPADGESADSDDGGSADDANDADEAAANDADPTDETAGDDESPAAANALEPTAESTPVAAAASDDGVPPLGSGTIIGALVALVAAVALAVAVLVPRRR